MPRLLHVVTHPEVEVRADVPVPDWSLSELGRRRAQGLLRLWWVPRVRHVFSSSERKAAQTAELLARACGATGVAVDPDLGENDRSATGFLPPAEFEELADLFFAHPARSSRGWETAQDAQVRVVGAVGRCLRHAVEGDVAVVCHGAVATLLWCHLAREPIDRRHDQPGQGSWYSVDLDTLSPLGRWRRLPLPVDPDG
ncbi:MAG TPA: histidine phosphatase family protein [Mycobacteriales bacterium]|nr:histidine phosphatase family protein [Mycobacteriales bacterium]